jgi:hypothetical protein
LGRRIPESANQKLNNESGVLMRKLLVSVVLTAFGLSPAAVVLADNTPFPTPPKVTDNTPFPTPPKVIDNTPFPTPPK